MWDRNIDTVLTFLFLNTVRTIYILPISHAMKFFLRKTTLSQELVIPSRHIELEFIAVVVKWESVKVSKPSYLLASLAQLSRRTPDSVFVCM
jgi:hypothetical protein